MSFYCVLNYSCSSDLCDARVGVLVDWLIRFPLKCKPSVGINVVFIKYFDLSNFFIKNLISLKRFIFFIKTCIDGHI